MSYNCIQWELLLFYKTMAHNVVWLFVISLTTLSILFQPYTDRKLPHHSTVTKSSGYSLMSMYMDTVPGQANQSLTSTKYTHQLLE